MSTASSPARAAGAAPFPKPSGDRTVNDPIEAWERIAGRTLEGSAVTLVHRKKKSTVYQLHDAELHCDIIAKYASPEIARHELSVYERILPQSGVAYPELLGALEQADGSWLFLERVRGSRYSSGNQHHRAIAGKWLATVHISTAELPGAIEMPVRGVEYFRDHLDAARANIGALDNPALTRDDLDVLQRVLEHCDAWASRWREVEDACARMPYAFVHNDFRERNVRVLGGEVMCFDWELSGWGIIGADLAQFTGGAVSPDLHTYYAGMRARWPEYLPADIHELATTGSILRLIASVRWASEKLPYSWIGAAMEALRMYELKLAAFLHGEL